MIYSDQKTRNSRKTLMIASERAEILALLRRKHVILLNQSIISGKTPVHDDLFRPENGEKLEKNINDCERASRNFGTFASETCDSSQSVNNIMLVKPEPGGGGTCYDGTSIYMYVHFWVCAIFKTPIFNMFPKFPLHSISFLQITEKSAPENHHFRVFAAPKTISLKFHRPRPVYCGCASPSAKRSASAPGPQPARMQPDARYKSAPDRDYQFTRRPAR